MNPRFLIFLWMLSTSIHASNDFDFQQANLHYQMGWQQKAMDDALVAAQTPNPNPEAQLFLAKIDLEHHHYLEAQERLTLLLEQQPNNTDASLILINVELSLKNDYKALTLVDDALLFNPLEPELTRKRTGIISLLQPPKPKTTTTHQPRKKRFHQKNEQPKTYKKPEPVWLNEVGVYQQQFYVSDRHQIWDYSTVYYGRQTWAGKVFAKMTYDNRFNQDAVQGEIEAFPKISKYLYLDVDYTFANKPTLFPDRAYGVEAYISTFKAFNYSFGIKYNDVDKNHLFTLYTGTVSKDLDNNRILFRPYHFTPGHGQNSTLYLLDVRHIVLDPNYYFGCIFGTGSSPDLANLTTVNFIVVQNKIISPYINIPFLNEELIVNLSALVQHQVFPRNHIRNWYGGSIGLNWKF